MPDPVTPPVKPTQDPVMQRIVGNLFAATLDDEGELKPITRADEKAVAELIANPAPEVPVVAATPPVESVVTPPVVPPEPATPPVADPAKPAEPPPIPIVPSKNDEVLELSKKIKADLDAINARMQAAPAPAPEPPKPAAVAPAEPQPSPDDEYDQSLPEDAQDVLDVLKWAEGRPEHKGKAGEYRAYLKKLDAYTKENPEAEASELENFQKINTPKLGNLRKLRDEKLIEQTEARITEKFSKQQSAELETVKKRQYEMEIKPVLAEAAREFANRFTEPTEGSALDPEAAKAILSNSPDVVEKYALEAPIVRRHMELDSEYLKLRTGLVALNPENPVHQQLLNFVARHEQGILSGPEAGKLRDGKMFKTNRQMDALRQSDPDADRKYWSLEDTDVRSRLEKNVHLVIASERKKVEDYAKKMGYTKAPAAVPPEKIAPKTETPAAPAAPAKVVTPPAEASPIAGASRAPGAGNPDPKPSSLMDSMKNLFPGVDKMAS